MEKFQELLKRINVDDKSYLQEYLKAKHMKYSPILDFMVRVNGIFHDTFYEVMNKDMRAIEFVFTSPKVWGEWSFNDPVQEIRILPSGMGSVKVVDGEITPQKWLFEKMNFKKAMIRFIIEKSYKQGTYGLLTPSRLVDLMKGGVIPYVLRITCYTKEARYKLTLNIPNGNVMADFRHRKIPPRLLKKRKVEEYLIFDRLYSLLDIPRFPKMVWEAVFESEGMDIETLTLIFNVPEKIIENNLAVLKKYNLVEEDVKSKIYRATLPMQAP